MNRFLKPLTMSLSYNNIERDIDSECWSDSECWTECKVPETRSRATKLPKHAFQAKRTTSRDLPTERKSNARREQKKRICLSRTDKRASKRTFIENSFPFADPEEEFDVVNKCNFNEYDYYEMYDYFDLLYCNSDIPHIPKKEEIEQRFEKETKVPEDFCSVAKVPGDFCSVAKAISLRQSLTLRDVLASMGLDNKISADHAFQMGIFIKKNMPDNPERQKVWVWREYKRMNVLLYPWYELATLEDLIFEYLYL